MNRLELKYVGRDLLRREKLRHKVFLFADSWDELKDARQLEAVIRLAGVDLPIETKRIFLLKEISGMKVKDMQRMNALQMMEVYTSVDFLLGEPELTRNLCPVLRLKRGPSGRLNQLLGIGPSGRLNQLCGPADGFGNLIIDEFIEADDHYFDYCQFLKEGKSSLAEQALDLLIATLWREKAESMTKESKHYRGDLREPFNPYLIVPRELRVRRLPMVTKLGCLYYYQGCRKMLQGIFKHVFDGAAEASSTGEPDRESWLKMVAHLPNEKFGTVENIGRLNLLSTFYVLDQVIAKHKKDLAELRAKSRLQ